MRIVFLFIFAFNLSSSQINSNLIELIEMRRDFTLNSIKLSNIEQYGHEVINNEISFLKTGLKYQNNTKLYPINKVDSIFHYLNLGNNSFYNNLNDSGQGAEYYIKAIEIARDVGNKPIICHTIRAKLWYQIWFSYGNLLENDEFLDLYKSNLYSEREKDIYSFFEALISLRKEKHESEDLKTISLTELPDYYKSWWFNDVAVFYHKKNKFKLSVDTFLKSIQIIDSNNSFIYKLKKAAIYENLVKASIRTNKLKDAKKYLKKALLDDYDNKLFLQNKTYYIYHKAEYFKNVKKWDSAYLYMVEFNSLISDLNQRKTLFQVQDLNKKYQTAEKEKQILLEQEQKKRFRNGVITLGSLLL